MRDVWVEGELWRGCGCFLGSRSSHVNLQLVFLCRLVLCLFLAGPSSPFPGLLGRTAGGRGESTQGQTQQMPSSDAETNFLSCDLVRQPDIFCIELQIIPCDGVEEEPRPRAQPEAFSESKSMTEPILPAMQPHTRRTYDFNVHCVAWPLRKEAVKLFR